MPSDLRDDLGEAPAPVAEPAVLPYARFRLRPRVFFLFPLLLCIGAITVGLPETWRMIATPAPSNFTGSARAQAEVTQHGMICVALDLYREDHGNFPDELSQLLTAPAKSASNQSSGPYVRDDNALIDPWQRPYRYRGPGKAAHNKKTYDLWSAGPDGMDDTLDDLTNWQQPPAQSDF